MCSENRIEPVQSSQPSVSAVSLNALIAGLLLAASFCDKKVYDPKS
jgi:hypothetical protein